MLHTARCRVAAAVYPVAGYPATAATGDVVDHHTVTMMEICLQATRRTCAFHTSLLPGAWTLGFKLASRFTLYFWWLVQIVSFVRLALLRGLDIRVADARSWIGQLF
jgi:hypothetical protein